VKKETRIVRWANCDKCGTFAVAECWRDGSFKQIIKACCHFSVPPKSAIDKAFAEIKELGLEAAK
jgi:hypothetical protein